MLQNSFSTVFLCKKHCNTQCYREATVNQKKQPFQETEAKCLALGDDPDDPEIRKCAWGGPEPLSWIRNRLMRLAKVGDSTWMCFGSWIFIFSIETALK